MLAFAIPLGVYVASLRPGIAGWDTAELQTVPWMLGIPHPSGFPAYVLIGWLWSHVVPFGGVAYRMNLLSAFGMALAAATIVGIAYEWEIEPVFGLGAALVFAFTRVPWDRATFADVHPLALAVCGCGFWAATRWVRTGAPRTLVLAAVAAAFALGIHSGMILVVPGIALAALARRPSRTQTFATIGLGIALVAACYAYLPIRSAIVFAQRRDPTLALGLAPGRPFWDNDHPASLAGFVREVSGGDFGTGRALRSIFDPRVLAELPVRYGAAAIGDVAGGIVLIALIGAFVVLRGQRLAGIGLLASGMLPVFFVLAYPAESDPERYFLPSYWMIAVFLCAGTNMLARAGMAQPPRSVIALVGGLFVFVAGVNVVADRDKFLAPSGTTEQPFIDRVVALTPPHAVIVAPWISATTLAYGAYVEHRFGDRILVTGWPWDYEHDYARWLRSRPVIVIYDRTLGALPGIKATDIDPLGSGARIFALEAQS